MKSGVRRLFLKGSCLPRVSWCATHWDAALFLGGSNSLSLWVDEVKCVQKRDLPSIPHCAPFSVSNTPPMSQPDAAVTPASPIDTTFTAGIDDARLRWTVANPPAATPSPSGLRVPFAGADLWGRTATGRTANDGAALVARVGGARVVARVRFTLRARRPWDQAGLFIRSPDASWWAKACVEAVPPACSAAGGAAAVLATSVTRRGWTDQATAPLPPQLNSEDTTVELQFVREGGSGAFYWRVGGGDAWTRIRLFPCHPDADGAGDQNAIDAGLYALAPAAAGCLTVFHGLYVGAEDGDSDGKRL